MLFAYDQFSVREATDDDRDRIWAWRNSESVRAWMSDAREIPYEDHVKWFDRRHNENIQLHIFEWGGDPVGVFTLRPNPSDHTDLLMTMYLIEQYIGLGLGIVIEWFMLKTAFESPECNMVSGTLFENNQVLSLHRFFNFNIEPSKDGFIKISKTRKEYDEIKESIKEKIFRH